MPKLTVLDIVQDILSEMDSDDVNSINDTEEAYQVARIIKNTYYETITAKYHKHFDRVKALDSASDASKPTHLLLPTDVIEMHAIKYNDNTIEYKDPQTFLRDAAQLTSNQQTVTDFGGISFKVLNNIDPSYWTSFDDEYIIFNSIDLSVDTTLQSSKSQAFVRIEPSFTISDTFVPDLPLQMFPQLIAEAKSTAFAHIKQMPSQKAEQKANRQRRRLSSQGRTNNGIKYPNYGR